MPIDWNFILTFIGSISSVGLFFACISFLKVAKNLEIYRFNTGYSLYAEVNRSKKEMDNAAIEMLECRRSGDEELSEEYREFLSGHDSYLNIKKTYDDWKP